MKIQTLAVIFIIIMLPLSIVLGAYTGNQIKTLNLQISYDTKLDNATYDALKAFQLNTVNSGSSDLANSKLRDIEASANTFFNAMASNFNMAGYNQEILAEYVPALVYTMYDGYYIYSAYNNKLDSTNQNLDRDDPNIDFGSDAAILNSSNPDATYKEGDRLSGLKPYIFYSCRYKPNADSDFVITYSLDNYITIQGKINGKGVFDYGYLIDLDSSNLVVTPTIKYRGVEIDTNETLEEYIWDPDVRAVKKYNYIKVNGVKYYYDKNESNNPSNPGYTCFTILNGEKMTMRNKINPNGKTAASEYYQKAYDFTDRVIRIYHLDELTGEHAVDENGQKICELDKDGNSTGINKFGNYPIFGGTANIEDSNSNFNQQRLAVIRYSIEKNLSIAITNFNTYSDVISTNFQMPELKEDEWEKIVNNVSIISFLQGLNIGGKVYNGYSIITNSKNEEVVKENSIYILDTDYIYHKANDTDIIDGKVATGVFNIDLERKSIPTANDGIKYLIPKRRRYTNRRNQYRFRFLF